MASPSISELSLHGEIGWPWRVDCDRQANLNAMAPAKSWPRVSIVTPSYNQAEFIEETIRSVLLQGYPNLEYIVIDGGSTDGSVDIIRRYEPWLEYWVSEADQGQSHAINKGWARSSGEIVAWLNSDDVYYPSAICSAVAALSRQREVAGVYSNAALIDGNGDLIALKRPCVFDFGRLLWNLGSYIPQPTTFLRNLVLEEVGFLDEELQYSMDYELWLRIGMRFALGYVDETWAATRFHREAKTVTSQPEIWEQKEKVLRKTFASPFLSVDWRSKATVIISAYYFKRAMVNLRGLRVLHTFRCIGRAIRLKPDLLLDRQNWWRLLHTVWQLVRRGRRLKYWPTA